MKTNKEPISNRRVKFLLIMASLVIIERSFMVSGIQAVPEQYLPLKLNKYQPIIHRVHRSLSLISLLLWQCSTLCFVLFRAKTFADYAEGAMFFVGILIVYVFYVSFAWQSTKVSEALADLKTTAEQRNRNFTVRSIYSEKAKMLEIWVNIFWKIVFVAAELAVFPIALFSFYRYNASDSSVNSFQSPFPCAFPWDWQSPIGYLAAICVQCYWGHLSALLVASIQLFFIVFCLFFEAFATDIKQCVVDLNASVVSVDRKLTAADRLELKQRLSDIVQFHSYVKEFIERFSELISVPMTVMFVLSSTLLCAIMLNLDTAIEHPIDIFRIGSCFAVVLTCIALHCFFGERVTTRFEEINDAVYDCSWERFPLEAQKLLLTMMIVCQKPVYIHGLNLRCTHEFFANIINGTYSFFIVLRDFNH